MNTILRRCRPLVGHLGRTLDAEPTAWRLTRQVASQPSTEVTSTSTSTATAREETIEEVRARVFGNHLGDGLRSGRKILRRPLIGDRVASYYPDDWFAGDPLLIDVEAERKKAKLQRLSRRGKAPPKKGSGKRAGKK